MQEARRAARQHVLGLHDDGALNTAAGYGAGDLAVLVDGHLGAGRPWGRALDADDRGQRDLVAARGPGVDLFEYVLHETPSSIRSAKASRDEIELPGSRRSRWGRAACMPRVKGS